MTHSMCIIQWVYFNCGNDCNGETKFLEPGTASCIIVDYRFFDLS